MAVKKRINVEIDDELRQVLKFVLAKEGKSMKDFIEECVYKKTIEFYEEEKIKEMKDGK